MIRILIEKDGKRNMVKDNGNLNSGNCLCLLRSNTQMEMENNSAWRFICTHHMKKNGFILMKMLKFWNTGKHKILDNWENYGRNWKNNYSIVSTQSEKNLWKYSQNPIWQIRIILHLMPHTIKTKIRVKGSNINYYLHNLTCDNFCNNKEQ